MQLRMFASCAAALLVAASCANGSIIGIQPSDAGDGATQDASDDLGFVPSDGGGPYLTSCSGDSDCGAGGQLCCSNVCVQTASCSFAVTGLSTMQGWQSGEDWINLTGAGFAKGMRVFVGGGRAPVRIVDPSHATILTPPGKTGIVDVKIQLGASSATLLHSFEYRSGGLTKTWEKVQMKNRRGEHPGLAVLPDGHLLVTGGTTVADDFSTGQATAEIFDRPTKSFVAAPKNAMSTSRCWSAAVTLLTGKALAVGASCVWSNNQAALLQCNAAAAVNADLYDPAINGFTPTKSPMNVPRGAPTRAVLLVDGRVLVASRNDPSLEIYDPETDSFKLVAHSQYHDGGFLVRLRDGRVLLGAGGQFGSNPLTGIVEAFDSDTDTFTTVGSLGQPRSYTIAVALTDGRALVAGGYVMGTPGVDSIEIFDPITNKFSFAPYKLTSARAGWAGVLVRDGTVLALGGDTPTYTTDVVDQIDPTLGTVTAFPKLPTASHERSTIRLLDGSVILAGGIIEVDGGSVSSDFIEFLAATPGPN